MFGTNRRTSSTQAVRLAAFAAWASLLLSCSSPADGVPPAYESLEPKLRSPDLVDRFVEASRLLLGIPYANGPLGEGDVGGPDPDPRVDLTRADCVTYLEESLALALSARRSEEDFLRILDAIRYRNGEVGFVTRNHFTMRDWVPANKWLLDDVTASVGEGHTETVRKTIDRASFLLNQGATPREEVDDPNTIEFAMIPTGKVGACAERLRTGDLVLWVAKKDGLDIAHTALLVRDPKDGTLLQRHASSRAGKVTDEPFAAYGERATFALGIVVLRVVPEAAIPGDPGDE
jgi:hypothetical protein